MATSRKAKTRKVARRREPAPGAPALIGLTSDWYWEQDAAVRVTRGDVRGDTSKGPTTARGAGPARRAMPGDRAPFRAGLMWRPSPDGARRYVSVSGEPVFDAKGRFF